ncbi:peroxidase 2-like [Triticum dicoccoides]|uniref:peroxidase 2-like n=1 Tax=Triticum dicoccoides TaxID=85692 RepID=UPI001891250E|nr:peroxidase 2-like [Triticum dicoccoides]
MSPLREQCKSDTGNDNTVVQDIKTPNKVDNKYYKNVLSHEVLFDSDATLMVADDTSAAARIKKEYGINIISCVDVMAFAGRDATYFLKYKIVFFGTPVGHYDGLVSFMNLTLSNLPPPFASLTSSKFASKRLIADEMVTLSSAQAIGMSHSSSFSSSFFDYLNASTSNMDPTLMSSLLEQCRPDIGSDNMVVQDVKTPNKVDNKYYNNMFSHDVLFMLDSMLMTLDDTSVALRANANDNGVWEEKFKAAMVRMGAIEVKTSANGEIRKNVAPSTHTNPTDPFSSSQVFNYLRLRISSQLPHVPIDVNFDYLV